MFATVLSERVLSILDKHREDDISVNSTKKFVYDMLEPSEDRHDMLYRYEHTIRVAENARIVALAENLPEQDLVIACLLHDVGYRECLTMEDLGNHQLISACIANEYLNRVGYPLDRIGEMIQAISRHSLTDNLPEDMSTFQITVRDCDDIDRFDIVRTSMVLGNCVHEKTNEEIIACCKKEIQKAEWVMSLPRGTKTAKELMNSNCSKRIGLLNDIIRQAQKGFDYTM